MRQIDLPAGEPGATQRVYLSILEDLEQRRLVPGQRLVETELADRLGVGRNAVREALKQLSVRGVVDLSRNRSPAIRKLDLAETMEVLDVAATMTGLMVRIAARNFDTPHDGPLLAQAIDGLSDVEATREPGTFSRARRGFYRALLTVGGNRELQRLFPAIGMHIIYSQFQSPRLQDIRRLDYRAIYDAVVSNDTDTAEQVGLDHVEHVRQIILELTGSERTPGH